MNFLGEWGIESEELPNIEGLTASELEAICEPMICELIEKLKESKALAKRLATWENVVLPIEKAYARIDQTVNLALARAWTNKEKHGHLESKAHQLSGRAKLALAKSRSWHAARKALTSSNKLSASQRKALEEYGWNAGCAYERRSDFGSKLEKIDNRLEELSVVFDKNIEQYSAAALVMANCVESLDGLPEWLIKRGDSQAREAGKSGCGFNPLKDYSHIMSLARSRDLRRKMYKARMSLASETSGKGRWDNGPVVCELLKLRKQKANLNGYDSYAQYILSGTMVKDGESVKAFLKEVVDRARAGYLKEKHQLLSNGSRSGIKKLQPWDEQYLRHAQMDSENKFRTNFPVFETINRSINLLSAMFCKKVKSVEMVSSTEIEARFGSGELLMISFNFAASLTAGFCFQVRPAWRRAKALVSMALSVDTNTMEIGFGSQELVALFHELGHAFHQLFSKPLQFANAIQALETDAIEINSMLFEQFVKMPDVLMKIGEGGMTVEEANVAYEGNLGFFQALKGAADSMTDICLHMDYNPRGKKEISQIVAEAYEQTGLLAPKGYARPCNSAFAMTRACYDYTYLWGEALAKRIFEKWKEESGGAIEDAVAGVRLYECIFKQSANETMRSQIEKYLGTELVGPQADCS